MASFHDRIDAGGRPPGVVLRRSGARRAADLLLLVLALGAALFLGGFVVFAEHVRRAEPEPRLVADGIVALTGAPQRIDEAAALLKRGASQRLLVSGVYEGLSRSAFASANPIPSATLDCCVDLGREARDTRGNAAETRDWAVRHGFHSLIVVTSAYHMPRSLAEFEKVMPDIRLLPYPVQHASLHLGDWSRDPEVFRIVFTEYLKYLFVRFT